MADVQHLIDDIVSLYSPMKSRLDRQSPTVKEANFMRADANSEDDYVGAFHAIENESVFSLKQIVSTSFIVEEDKPLVLAERF